MIKVFKSNDADYCAESLIESLRNRKDDREIFIICPDAYTFSVENQLAGIDGAGFKAEVMSFSRFASLILGNKIKKCLTPVGCTMIMTKALYNVKDDLKYYGSSLSRKGFVNEIYSSITAIRSSGISVDDLLRAAEKMKGYNAGKTRDLATIYNAYLKELQGRYNDPTTRLEALVKEIPNSQRVKDGVFCIVDFYEFNAVQYKVIEQLMRNAYEVNIAVVDQGGGLGNRAIYPDVTTQAVKNMGRKAGSPYKEVDCFYSFNDYSDSIMNKLYDVCGAINCKKDVEVKLLNPPSPQDEIDGVLREIARLVRDENYRYKDIAVVAGDILDPTIDSAFSDFNIPYFKNKEVPLSDDPAAKYVLSLLKLAVNNYERETVISFLRNPLSQVSALDSQKFELFALKYGIDRSRFKNPFVYSTSGNINEKEKLAFEEAEKVRARFIEQQIKLDSSALVETYVDALRDHLKEIKYDKHFKDYYYSLKDDRDAMNRAAQVPEKLSAALDTMKELLSGLELNLSDFADLLRASLEAVKIALIPSINDCVFVGTAKDCKYEKVKALFVIGAAEGKIPAEEESGSILTDNYNSELQSHDLVIRPAVKEENKFAKFCLAEILCKPSKLLVVSCPEYDVKGEAVVKSELFDMLSSMFSVKAKSGFEHTFAQKAVTEKQCFKLASYGEKNDKDNENNYSALRLSLTEEDSKKVDRISEQRNKPEIKDAAELFLPNNKSSVSKMESYFYCPYQFFIQYGLKAQERETDEIAVNETGTFIHEVLERYFKEHLSTYETDSPGKRRIDAEEIAKKVLDEDPRLKSLKEDVGSRRVDRMLYEAVDVTVDLAELSLKGDFRPKYLEAKFDDNGGLLKSIKLKSGTALTGKIDRIDVSDDDLIALDYKTGAVDAKLKDVYYGRKIQLLVYLNALKSMSYRPVGAFYVPVNASYGKRDYEFVGQMIDSNAIYLKLDRDLTINESSEVISVKKKNGAIKGAGDLKCVKEDEFDALMDYVMRLLEYGDARIREGKIEPTPLADSCDNCKMKHICYEAEPKRRKSTEKKIEDFIYAEKEEDDE
ncbi:MAG: PD-(D/E)XK nuclease family protein [Clostridia bacterium]|nr:PD-(D/E)XK nuclease family protein [Clostridia bacterium]